MAGVIIGRMPHSCGSRDGLNIYDEDGKVTGFCFACKQYEPDPLDGGEPATSKMVKAAKTPEQIQEELNEIGQYPVAALPARMLSKKALEYFGVHVSLDQERQENVEVHYYPYHAHEDEFLCGYKARIVEGKRMFSIGRTQKVLPFGWTQAVRSGSPKLFITEGEIDAMSLFELIMIQQKGTAYEGNKPAVVSIPHGASGASRDISLVMPLIQKHFKEVVLVFDNDAAGRGAVEDVLKILPEAKVATVPGKDVNECVLGGHKKALFKAVMFDARIPKNTRLVYADDLFEAAKEQAEFGVSYPWQATTELTRGIRTGETIYIGAAQKMGKSEVVNALAAHLIKTHGWKVMLAKPEEANKKSVKLLAGKLVNKIFHDPKIPFDEEAFDKACTIMRDKVVLLNLYQHMGWESLAGDIRTAASQGCKAIFIDPITNLTNGMDAASANTKLQEIAQELAAMALDLDVVIFIFCHLRNPETGTPHERGGKVLSSQFAGSRAMARSCNYMFGIEGNKDPELDEDSRNVRHLVLLEDREFGEVGSTDLHWSKHTGAFTEI